MARGKRCPQCGYQMYAVHETDEPKGSWVTYECRNGTCRFRERVFEAS